MNGDLNIKSDTIGIVFYVYFALVQFHQLFGKCQTNTCSRLILVASVETVENVIEHFFGK